MDWPASINPALAQSEDWAPYAAVLDTAAADGIDVAAELPSVLAAHIVRTHAVPHRRA